MPAKGENQDRTGLADLSQTLTDFISSGSNATFTCGGTISLADVTAAQSTAQSTAQSSGNGSSSSSKAADEEHPQKKRKTGAEKAVTTSQEDTSPAPIIIRWDRSDGSTAKIHLPIAGDQAQAQALEDLVSDCQPAGFGHRGQDLLDENVRKAWAMDSSRFATNLCPYLLGIADRVTQILLPNTAGVGPEGLDCGGIVKVEPYKLNVYKGPSGFFKTHVDTPRGATHFGSLVLCLPSPHRGGQLTVGHHGQDPVAYDWDGPDGTDTLQWAAFYSDCEHEVHEVTDGYRVTLMYNLYYAPRDPDMVFGLGSKPAPVDITKLAPFAKMQALLANPKWMKDGGVLGIYCSYAYATTTSKVVVHDPPEFRWRNSDKEPSPEPPASDRVTMLKGTDMSLYAVFVKLGLGVRIKPILNDDKRLSDHFFKYPREGKYEPGIVSKTDLITYEDQDAREILEIFHQLLYRVRWVTKPLWKNLGLIQGNYYGNEAGGPGVGYTYTAMLVTIPDAASRQAEVEASA